MQIHVHLIPISPPAAPTGPDPPDTVFHYTTGRMLTQIINSGHIRPSNAHVPPNENPVAWFSTSREWEPTATKCSIPGKLGQLITAKAQSGLVRITVPGTSAPYIFPELSVIAGTKPSVCLGLLVAGLELGADPDTWRFTPTPVPTAFIREVAVFDFEHASWLAVDMAELACRN
jgi:hypothetical protein